MIRAVLSILILVLVGGCAVDKASSALFLAKELCSCRFVVGQSEARCRDAVRLALAAGDARTDEASKSVTGMSEDGRHVVVFRHVSPRHGCARVQ